MKGSQLVDSEIISSIAEADFKPIKKALVDCRPVETNDHYDMLESGLVNRFPVLRGLELISGERLGRYSESLNGAAGELC